MPRKKNKESTKKVEALNIRNFPSDLRWTCKEAAGHAKTSLTKWVIKVLREAAEDELKP